MVIMGCFCCSMTVDDMWEAVDKPDNVTQTVSNILKNYDIRLRPNFGGTCSINLAFKIYSAEINI